MTDENKVVRIVYTFFLGLMLAIFVGVGINTFYEGPKAPTWESVAYEKEPTEQQIAIEKANIANQQKYEELRKPYTRNVSIISLASSVIFLSVSVLYQKKIKFIADGVMLGGLFTLLYSIIKSFESTNSKYQFLAITIGLISVAALGYLRFVKHTPKN